MKFRTILASLILSTPVFICAFLPAKPITIEKEIQQAARDLTPSEKEIMSAFLTREIGKAEFVNNQQQVNKLKKIHVDFQFKKYGPVIKQLATMHPDVRRHLKMTNLRKKMLTGELQRQPLWLREIAALDYLLKVNNKKNINEKRWKTVNAQAQYVVERAQDIISNHHQIKDPLLLKNAIKLVTVRLQAFKNVKKVFQKTKTKIDITLNQLETVKNARNLTKPIFTGHPPVIPLPIKR